MLSDTLLVIDGNSLAHRAFHAIPLLSTSQGIITNAVFGFTSMLLKVLDEQPAERVAVCFDKGKITFRHNDYEEYKAHRKATPDELRPQFPLIKELLQALRIQALEYEGYEADDLIGTLVARSESLGLNSIVLTGDQDALQLISPKTKVLLTRKGISELEEYTEEKVLKRFGITPAQFADFKGLVGDQSDNIPGIPGIGPKTAASLLTKYGSLEGLISQSKELPERYREKIKIFASQALLSKHLATIVRNVPVEINLDKYCWPGPNHQELLVFFNKLEFKSFIRSLTKEKYTLKGLQEHKETRINAYRVEYRLEEADGVLADAKKAKRIALALKGNREKGVVAAALALTKNDNLKVTFLSLTKNEKNVEVLREICMDQEIEKIVHDGKNALWMLKTNDISIKNLGFDTMVAAYLINPGSPNQDLQGLTLEHFNVLLPSEEKDSLAAQAEVIHRLASILETKLRLLEVEQLFYEVEMPLISVLAGMEMAGVTLDIHRLNAMSDELGQRLESLSRQIYQAAGEEFNINSTKQLSHVLFEKLKLPVIKKTKTGYSTDAGVLEELAGAHPIVAKILEYRQLMKLKSTYVDGLKALINPNTGRVHTTFHQTVTLTGRLSSSDPNLQNIPIRLEEGRKIRQVFIPRKKCNFILAADYSQIELRILAHMSSDPNLVEAFQRGEDIHIRTASEVFGVAVNEVTTQMRTKAKAVNFGIVYGLSDFGLARDIGVTRQEAKLYIDSYFKRYKGVKKYIDLTVAEARERGYVSTILNRRRYLPDLFSPNRSVRSFGERTAVNTPIQGSAADIIKLAMIQIYRALKERRLQTQMILQVHDELIFDVPCSELEEVKEIVRNYMENAIKLKVPVMVEIKIGPNWYDVKKI